MKAIFVLALCIAGAYGASYGSRPSLVVPEIRVPSYSPPLTTPAPVLSYEPVVIKKSGYETPVLVKSSYALPEVKKPIIPIVRFELDDDNYGTFKFDSLSGDGTKMVEEGHLKNLPGDVEGPVSVMSGSYSFLGDDGKTYTVNWVADETGFHASGDHLPTPVPLPVENLKVIKEFELLSKGSYSSSSLPLVLKSEPSYASAPLPAIRVVSSGY